MLAAQSTRAPAVLGSRQQRCRGRGASSRSLKLLVCCCSQLLVVYTKPDCPLCDGLKDKVSGLIDRAKFMPSMLSSYELEVRDISTNDAWTAAYAFEVPVLAAVKDGKEAVLPRPMPRITADRLQKHIEEALGAL